MPPKETKVSTRPMHEMVHDLPHGGKNMIEKETGITLAFSDPDGANIPEPKRRLSKLLVINKRSFILPHLQSRVIERADDFRGKLLAFIHSHKVQTALVLLLVLDVACVITELILHTFTHCQNKMIKSAQCPESFFIANHGDHLHEHPDGRYYVPSTQCGFVSEVHGDSGPHTAGNIIRWISISILFIFAFELLCLMFCLRAKFFTKLYLFDTVVIGVSLGVDLALHNTASDISAIIIFLRLWRFVRILHGFGMTVHEYEEERLDAEKEKEETLEKQNEFLRVELQASQSKIDLFQDVLSPAQKAKVEEAIKNSPQLSQTNGKLDVPSGDRKSTEPAQ